MLEWTRALSPDFDGPLRALVQPLLDVHLVRLLAVVVLLPELLHPPPARVHQLDDAVRGARHQQWDGAQDDAAVDVGDLAALEN